VEPIIFPHRPKLQGENDPTASGAIAGSYSRIRRRTQPIIEFKGKKL